MQKITGVWKKFTRFLEGGIEEDDWPERDYVSGAYDEPYEQEYYEDELDLGATTSRSTRSSREYASERERKSNVVAFDTRRAVHEQTIIRIVRPKEMQDATLVCDYMRDNVICIIDMQGAERPTAQRIADYLGGVSYALRGQVERVDSYIFIMAPEGIKIDAELKEELKSGGLFKSFV